MGTSRTYHTKTYTCPCKEGEETKLKQNVNEHVIYLVRLIEAEKGEQKMSNTPMILAQQCFDAVCESSVADLWLGLQLQWTAWSGQQWKSADTM